MSSSVKSSKPALSSTSVMLHVDIVLDLYSPRKTIQSGKVQTRNPNEIRDPPNPSGKSDQEHKSRRFRNSDLPKVDCTENILKKNAINSGQNYRSCVKNNLLTRSQRADTSS